MLKITEEDLKKIYNQKKSRFDKKKEFVSAGFTSIKLKEFNDWASKTNQKCHYCGLSNDESKLLNDLQRNGKRADGTRGGKRGKRIELDRKDPKETYDNLDNLVWCCYWCNNAKSNFFTEEEFKPIGKSIGMVLKQIITSYSKSINL